MEKDLHNIHKFESQRIEQYKIMRHEKFKELDVEFFKALENNDTEQLQKIKEKKEVLRNIDQYVFPDFEDPRDIIDYIPDFLM